ncbi:MAG: hypothetical protein VKK63_11615 [Synechococcus sp.]|nr:hypothetical protein [Synechococcus sp.]
MDSETVGQFHVRDNWHILCRVTYRKGAGYLFEADPMQDMGDGVICLPLGAILAGRAEVLLPAKRFSRKQFAALAQQMRSECEAEAPRVMRHVAEATERVTRGGA